MIQNCQQKQLTKESLRNFLLQLIIFYSRAIIIIVKFIITSNAISTVQTFSCGRYNEKIFKLHYLLVCKTYFGRFMKRNFGRNSMKKIFTHGCIVWVWGDLKWTLSTTTVTHILRWNKFQSYWSFTQLSERFHPRLNSYLIDTNIIANIRYLPSKGTTKLYKKRGWKMKRKTSKLNQLEKSAMKKLKIYSPRWRNDFNNQQKEHVKTN